MNGKMETDISKWIHRMELDSRFPANSFIYDFHSPGNEFLSNFYPCEIEFRGLKYASTEHFFQSFKPIKDSISMDGQLWSEKIRLANSPGATKKLARQCPMRPNWDKIRLSVMEKTLYLKFYGTELEERLIATGDAYLIEGNCWKDNFWGICISKNGCCGNAIGKNKLGSILMEIREKIKEGDCSIL